MLKGRCGAVLGLTLFAGLGVFGIWTEISSQPSTAPERQTSSHKTNQQAHQSKQETLGDFFFHDGITTFTFVLACFTGVLALIAIIQIRYLIRANNTARISTDAAKQAADALPIVE